MKIHLKDASIYAFAPRRFAWAEHKQVREITDDLLARGIIKPSVSPYCARVVPVRKRNGSMRLCVDLRPLNARVVKQKYLFPLIEDCLSRLGEKTIFTLLDMKDGFHQIKIHPEHTKYFSFATPDGQYEYVRLSFGYCDSPAEFQKRVVQILQPLIRQDKIVVYIDDILIPSISVEENLSTLREVLILLRKYNFELNLPKYQFLRTTIEYLGYIISPSGITLSDRHTNAVQKFPWPKNAHEVQQFLGLTNYFRKFVNDYATKAKPLYNLLKTSIEIQFDTTYEQAFDTLKRELTSFQVLRLYNPHAETELHTDASAHGLAAILMQKQKSSQWAPVSYYSQATNQAEANYHSFELEMLAIVKAVERFHVYLYGLDFTVVTDCNALVYAINKANLNPGIARWTLRLQDYKFKVTHRAGRQMFHVDALSRNIGIVEALPFERELEYKQLQDVRIKEIAEKLEQGDDEKFELLEGLVYRKGNDRSRFYVPESMVNAVIRSHHDNMAHCGYEKTHQGVYKTYWFPSMRKRIYDYISNCLVCLMANSSSHSRESEVQLVDHPSIPFAILHVDHFGPLQETEDGFRHILVIVDAYMKFTFLFASKSTGTKEVISNLQSIFDTFGNPKEIVTDRGSAFASH